MPGPNDYPDLSRTAAALDVYDRAAEEFNAGVGKSNLAEAHRLMDAVEAAGKRVAEAFADDTADRNSRDNALLMTPTPKRSHPDNNCTVRRWVRQFQERGGKPVTV
jgi:hypothetical protein